MTDFSAPSDAVRTATERMFLALDGLSLGDAFGENFFGDSFFGHDAEMRIIKHQVPEPVWSWTDDTNMAISVVEVLHRHGTIHQDALARNFAARYDRTRGYGSSMHDLLPRLARGESWKSEAAALFGGQGSHGNGAAMRVAPLGAYFADDVPMLVDQARRSAEVTHAHPEGIAGAIAVALAAGWACRLQSSGQPPPSIPDFIDLFLSDVPDSVVREGIRHARNLALGSSVALASSALGCGWKVSAQDTVPFTIWCAARHLADYRTAMWTTVSALGDRDTTCAIVGGIVACYTGRDGVPADWLERREPLPSFPQDL